MTLARLLSDISIVEVDEVNCNGECENYYRLYIESKTSDALSITLDVTKDVFESIPDSEFWNSKKITEIRNVV